MVIVVRKTDVFADWLDRLRDLRGVHAFKPGLSAWPQETPAMWRQWDKASQKQTIQLALAMAKEIQ